MQSSDIPRVKYRVNAVGLEEVYSYVYLGQKVDIRRSSSPRLHVEGLTGGANTIESSISSNVKPREPCWPLQ